MSAELSTEEALKLERPFFIDLRSPAEFLKGSIPDSINIPLLDDEERAIIGLIYRQDQQQAHRQGLSFVSPKLPEIAAQVEHIQSRGSSPVLYCWRGGMRSKSLYELLTRVMTPPIYRLEGGYKAYRNFVLGRLQNYELTAPLFVLNGLTGAGKTDVLAILEESGAPVLDLEGLARHRGSAFGHLGLPAGPRCQKDFDGSLYDRLEKLRGAGYLLIEGEGKKIGPIHLPDFLYRAILEGRHILLTAPLDLRVERLLKEYTPETEEEIRAVVKAIRSLQKYLGRTKVEYFVALAEGKNFPELVSRLCVDYYDRHYKDAKPGKTPFILEADSSHPWEAAQKINDFIKEAIR